MEDPNEDLLDEVPEQDLEDVLLAFQLLKRSIRDDLFNYAGLTFVSLFMVGFSIFSILRAASTGQPVRQEWIWLLLMLMAFIPLAWYSLHRIFRALRLRRLLDTDPKQAFLDWDESRFKW